jgi:branched-subunit amino acid transport protein
MSWLIILAVAATTFLMRLSFIAAVKPHRMPAAVQRALRFVPPAVFAAIIMPPILIRDEVLHASLDNPRLIAAIAAFGIAWFTRSVLGTIVAGMGVLWVMQWASG